jgi:sugar phosphate isomerase/epimerase
MIFVSSGGVRDQVASKTALDFYNHGITNVELSGGSYSENYHADLLNLPSEITLQLHNYFPPARNPFVFNLASVDPETAELSINHVRKAMDLGLALGNSTYSFHAGFRIDPRIRDLGQKLSKSTILDRNIALELFSKRVSLLANEAKDLGVTLLIENNVLNAANLLVYGEDPLLFTHPDEIAYFMSQAPSNVSLLLDVAHLKVSSNSLKFNLIEAHEKLTPWIKAYHLSDNDGTQDSNDPVHEASWFWPYLREEKLFYTLEIYNISNPDLLMQYHLVNKKLFGDKVGSETMKL